MSIEFLDVPALAGIVAGALIVQTMLFGGWRLRAREIEKTVFDLNFQVAALQDRLARAGSPPPEKIPPPEIPAAVILGGGNLVVENNKFYSCASEYSQPKLTGGLPENLIPAVPKKRKARRRKKPKTRLTITQILHSQNYESQPENQPTPE